MSLFTFHASSSSKELKEEEEKKEHVYRGKIIDDENKEMSSFTWPFWSSSKELKKEEDGGKKLKNVKKKRVHRSEIIDDEIEAASVWKSILKRKGLPLDTKYEYVDTLDKGYDESYCDMLYLTIEKKKENPEAAKSWGRSTFGWLPPPASPTRILSRKFLTYDSYFDDREHGRKSIRHVNGILYPYCSEAANKRSQLSLETTKKNMELHPPIACRFCP